MATSERAATWEQVPRGTWVGVACSVDESHGPAKCKGMCNSCYGKSRWAAGVRPPSLNARSRRDRHLKHRYGISLDEYESKLAEQGGVCACCGELPSELNMPKHWNGI